MTKLIRIIILILIGLFLRFSLISHSYSGENTPPMYGDYEAQRHWQEITINLSIENWYKNTTDNDLNYWGLDYPPLTAYHSYIIGKLATIINNNYTKLHLSRGYESQQHKLFMRLSVIISDIITFILSIIIYFNDINTNNNNINNNNSNNKLIKLKLYDKLCLNGLIYPGLILIDHGHFQYNCVSLGLFIYSCTAIKYNKYLLSSLLFVLSLNYKQMELYHSLSFFIYILGNCWYYYRKKLLYKSIKLFTSISLIVILTFIIIWLPFYWKNNFNGIINIIDRLFPIKRGLFEDKVSNIWCLINIIIKLNKNFTNIQLAKLSLIITTLSIIPVSYDLFINSRCKKKFLLSLINISMNFYLFSYQVHEKTILLVAIPVILYFHYDPFICFWFLFISIFSMLSLLIKDGLFIGYVGLMFIYYISIKLMWNNEFFMLSIMKYYGNSVNDKLQLIVKCLFYCSIIGVIFLSIISICLKPMVNYPDLFSLMIAVYSCIHFILFSIYFHVIQIFFVNDVKIVKNVKLH